MKKNFKKKCIAYVTAVVLALSIIPIASVSGVVSATGAEATVTINNIEYAISNGVAEVKSGLNASGAVDIPDTITYEGSEYKVTSIASDAFRYSYQDNTSIVSVSIGKNVATIGARAFSTCTSLKSVTFGAGLKSLSNFAFSSCALKSIDIPAGVTEIPEGAFMYNAELVSAKLPDSVTKIGDNAFTGCTLLESIKLPEGVTYIGGLAFLDCSSMTSIYIPNSVESIRGAAFGGCKSLKNITIPCDFNKDLFLSQTSSIGPCIIVSEDDPDSYQIVRSDYYNSNSDMPEVAEISWVLATGTFTYTHDIQYKANEATITASCKNCNSNAGSVTIIAPTELEYTGEPILATLSGKITASGVSTPTIKYTAADGSTLTDGKPVEPGTYTASITLGGVTASVEYTVSGDSSYDDDDDDVAVSTSSDSTQTLNVASDNVVASDAPVEDVALENSTEELLSSDIFTVAEKRQIANGSSAKVYVGIDSLPVENVPQADRNAIESEATASLGTNFAIQYMDMSLFKQVGSAASQKVSEPGVGIKVTVELPSNLINRNAGVSRRYVVIRLHDGVVTTLETTFDSTTNKLAFSTDRFSTYAIAYTDEAVATGNLTDASSPKTGDTANIPALLAIMAVAGMMMMVWLAREQREF